MKTPLATCASRLLSPLLAIWGTVAFLSSARGDSLRVYTSPAFGQVLATLTPVAREEGVDLSIKGETSSTIGLQMLADGQADVVFTVRLMTGEDRAVAPDKPFIEVQIATQATAVLVSRDVWEGGVRALSKEKLRQIYEREVTNWKQVGGADRAIKFFNYERGQGVWEHFAQWVYGEIRRAPLGKFDIVVTGEDARNTVEFTGGSITLAPVRWSDGKEVFAVALGAEETTTVAPTSPHLLDRTYPLARPVLAVFADKPTGMRRRLLDFLQGEKCRELLAKSGLVVQQ